MNIDAPTEMRSWFAQHEAEWIARTIVARLRLPDPPGPNKAVATFETPTHVGSLTAWGTGTLEFIVLDLSSSNEVVASDKEYATVQELRTLLDDSVTLFDQIIREARLEDTAFRTST